MLHKLVFDTTDSTSIADSAHVGAHNLDGAGALIGSQVIGAGANPNWLQAAAALYDSTGVGITSTAGSGAYAGHTGIDVSLISPITVETDFNGIYNVSTNPTPANAGIIAFVRNATPGLAQQTETPTAGVANQDAVVAANVTGLDTNAFNMLYNGTTWDRWHGTAGSANVNVTNMITTSDAALGTVTLANDTTALAVANTSQDAIAAPLAARKYVWLYNNDNKNMWVGTTGVTSANGFPLPPGSLMELRAGAAVAIQFVSTHATADLRHLELS